MSHKEERTYRVGSRKSQLALIQANHVVKILSEKYPEKKFEVVAMSTVGDKILNTALSKIGEKSLFTKELEIALGDKKVDFVVHSLKDLPTVLPENMVISSLLKRDSPFDAVVMHPKHKGKHLDDLPSKSVIGTSSLRRIAQLKRKFPELEFEDIRGNLNTRLKKLDDDNKYSAIVLAEAGLDRMGWGDRNSQVLSPNFCMYAVSQGALGVESLSDDGDVIDLLASIADPETLIRCTAERSFLRELEGGCSVPVAVHSEIRNGKELYLRGGVFSLDGKEAVTGSATVGISIQIEPSSKRFCSRDLQMYASIVSPKIKSETMKAAVQLGKTVADLLIEQGAKPILVAARERNEIEQAKAKDSIVVSNEEGDVEVSAGAGDEKSQKKGTKSPKKDKSPKKEGSPKKESSPKKGKKTSAAEDEKLIDEMMDISPRKNLTGSFESVTETVTSTTVTEVVTKVNSSSSTTSNGAERSEREATPKRVLEDEPKGKGTPRKSKKVSQPKVDS